MFSMQHKVWMLILKIVIQFVFMNQIADSYLFSLYWFKIDTLVLHGIVHEVYFCTFVLLLHEIFYHEMKEIEHIFIQFNNN